MKKWGVTVLSRPRRPPPRCFFARRRFRLLIVRGRLCRSGRTSGRCWCPKEGKDAVPGAVLSKDPPGELAAGKARAALLTPGQAARLTAGFRAYPVPEGKGLIPVRAEGLTEDGQSFLLFLLREDRQDALRENGLFSLTRRLYSPEDPVRYLVDGSRDFPG